MIAQTWWGYECRTCDTLIDMRIDDVAWPGDSGPEVICPVCGSEMTYKDSWPADKYGYGSRGDAPGSLIVDIKDLEVRAQAIREFLADMDPDNAGSVMLALAGEKALAADISPETFGRMAETLALALIAQRKGGTA